MPLKPWYVKRVSTNGSWKTSRSADTANSLSSLQIRCWPRRAAIATTLKVRMLPEHRTDICKISPMSAVPVASTLFCFLRLDKLLPRYFLNFARHIENLVFVYAITGANTRASLNGSFQQWLTEVRGIATLGVSWTSLMENGFRQRRKTSGACVSTRP